MPEDQDGSERISNIAFLSDPDVRERYGRVRYAALAHGNAGRTKRASEDEYVGEKVAWHDLYDRM